MDWVILSFLLRREVYAPQESSRSYHPAGCIGFLFFYLFLCIWQLPSITALLSYITGIGSTHLYPFRSICFFTLGNRHERDQPLCHSSTPPRKHECVKTTPPGSGGKLYGPPRAAEQAGLYDHLCPSSHAYSLNPLLQISARTSPAKLGIAKPVTTNLPLES